MDHPINILILNSARSWGGNERWSATTANALADRGHQVHLACRTDIFSGRLAPEVMEHRLPFRHELDYPTLVGLSRIVQTQNIQVLLPTKRKEYWIAGRYGRKHKVAVVFRLGIVRRIRRGDLLKRYIYGRLPHAIVVNSQSIRKGLTAATSIPKEKVHVVYNGYAFPPFGDDEKIPDVERNGFVFAAAGRLTDQKGFDVLVNAAGMLKAQGIAFTLYIAGAGPDRGNLEVAIAAGGLRDQIRLLGHLINVRGLFSQADGVIIPSRNEGVPNTLMEAWSLEKPVIASNVAGLPEVIDDDHNGLLSPLDPMALAATMQHLVTSPELASRLGREGYTTLTTRFTLDRMVLQLEDVFTSAMDRKSRAD